MSLRDGQTRRDRRRAAWRAGQRGEALAAWWLRAKGYRILARGQRSKLGEIDIVARRGPILALIEVKYRPSLEAAAASITPRQRQRIARAATLFLQSRPELAGLQPRFDALLLAPGRLPRHLPGAWEAPD